MRNLSLLVVLHLIFSPLLSSIAWGQSSFGDVFAPQSIASQREPITSSSLKIMKSTEAASSVRDSELVIGVSLNDESRAYPLSMISGPSREIINDKLDDRSIAVTWCSLCYSALVFDRETDRGILELAVSGQLWHNNMVFYDTKTNSLWSQIRGEAMRGQFKGSVLKRLPADVMTWQTWKSMHPQTTVATFERTANTFDLKTLKQKDRSVVFALVTDQGARAWSYAHMREHSLLQETWYGQHLLIVKVDESGASHIYSRNFGSIELTFRVADGRLVDDQSHSQWDFQTGRSIAGPLAGAQLVRLPTVTSFKEKWLAFYPKTEFVD